MGAYFVPGALSAKEVGDYALPSGGSTLEVVEGGVLVTDATRSDSDLAAMYAGYTPTDATDDTWRPRLASALVTHVGHLRDYEDAIRAGTPVTNAQTVHVLADVIAWIRLTEDRL